MTIEELRLLPSLSGFTVVSRGIEEIEQEEGYDGEVVTDECVDIFREDGRCVFGGSLTAAWYTYS